MKTNIPDLPKHYTPALYFEMVDRGVRCALCPFNCRLKEGQTGVCHTRKNINGKLYALNYGKLCAVHIDPIEKKPLYHFLPGSKTLSIASAGCNLKCLNCQNWSISQASPLEVGDIYMTPAQVVEMAIEHGCPSISYTYTDPIVSYEFVLDTMLLAHERGLKNVIVSAGYINSKPLLIWSKYIDAANIDLKGFDEAVYMKLNGVQLHKVLDTLKKLKEQGVWLEITNLIIPSFTDNIEQINAMCQWLIDNGFHDVPLHFSRFFPTHRLSYLQPTPVEILHKAREIAIQHGIQYVYLGNI